MSTSENWADIPGYEGCYQASDLGRVRSVDRYVDNAHGTQTYKRGVLLSPALNSSNRLGVNLHRDGEGRHMLVHQIVALAFIGPRPAGMETCHNDGDHFNNALSNLRYDTRSANMLDRVKHGTHQMARKTHCKRGHELSEDNVRMDRNMNGSLCRTCRQCERITKRARRARASAVAA